MFTYPADLIVQLEAGSDGQVGLSLNQGLVISGQQNPSQVIPIPQVEVNR